MPLRVFNAARCFYLQLRDGKKHTGTCSEKELSRLPVVTDNGCLDLDYSQIQGGHVAFILTAMLSKKVNKIILPILILECLFMVCSIKDY